MVVHQQRKKKREPEPLVLKRKGRHPEGDDEPHGGWKIAYADFVTAMMAFFLVLWLIAATDPEQKKGLSEYFNPYKEEEQTSSSPTGGIIAIFDGGMMGGSSQTEREPRNQVVEGATAEEGAASGEASGNEASEEASWMDAAMQESQTFDALREGIESVMQKIPELKSLSENLIIEETPEGLRIQIIDKDGFSMFRSGSSDMEGRAQMLVSAIARIVSAVPNKIAVSGHTDGVPYTAGSDYTNWELSSDRAHAARRQMIEAGVPADSFARIEGLADTIHLIIDNPRDPRNRRISILMMRDRVLSQEELDQLRGKQENP